MSQWIFYDQTIFAIDNVSNLGKTIFLPNLDNAYPANWSSLTEYNLNDLVKYNSIVYISLQNTNNNQQPDTQTSWWSVFKQGDINGYSGYSGADLYYAVEDGHTIIIKDETGLCNNSSNKITVKTTKMNVNRIDMRSGFTIENAYGYAMLYHAGGNWYIISENGVNRNAT